METVSHVKCLNAKNNYYKIIYDNYKVDCFKQDIDYKWNQLKIDLYSSSKGINCFSEPIYPCTIPIQEDICGCKPIKCPAPPPCRNCELPETNDPIPPDLPDCIEPNELNLV